MITVLTTCPHYQTDVKITPSDIVIRHTPGGSVYRFNCPLYCGWHEKPANERVVNVLVASNVVVVQSIPDPLTGGEVDEAARILHMNVHNLADLEVW